MRQEGGLLRAILRVTLLLEVLFTDKRNGHVSGMLISTKKSDTCWLDIMIPLYKIDIGLATLPFPCQVVKVEVTKYVTMSAPCWTYSTHYTIFTCPFHLGISLTLSYNLLVSIRLGPRSSTYTSHTIRDIVQYPTTRHRRALHWDRQEDTTRTCHNLKFPCSLSPMVFVICPSM